MLSSVEQAFVERDKKRAPLKTPAWEDSSNRESTVIFQFDIVETTHINSDFVNLQ